jgi:hypothetical protein
MICLPKWLLLTFAACHTVALTYALFCNWRARQADGARVSAESDRDSILKLLTAAKKNHESERDEQATARGGGELI